MLKSIILAYTFVVAGNPGDMIICQMVGKDDGKVGAMVMYSMGPYQTQQTLSLTPPPDVDPRQLKIVCEVR